MDITSNMIIKADGTTGQNIKKGTGIKTLHIQKGAVTRAKIRNNAVSSVKIGEADGTTDQDANKGCGIKSPHIQDGAVTTTKIADGAVTGAKINDGSVNSDKLSADVKEKFTNVGLTVKAKQGGGSDKR